MKRPEIDGVAPLSKRTKTENIEYEIDEEEVKLIKTVMGIEAFDSSKGKDHSSSDHYGVMKVPKRQVKAAFKKLKEQRKERKEAHIKRGVTGGPKKKPRV
jgi:hypothetical protein